MNHEHAPDGATGIDRPRPEEEIGRIPIEGAQPPDNQEHHIYPTVDPEHVPQHTDQTRAEALGALSITELLEKEQINPEAARKLTAREKVRRAYKAFEKYGAFAPAVASEIANHHEEQVEVIRPTAQQIKEENFGARIVSGFLGIFSSSWANRFDRYLENKAGRRISQVAYRTTSTLDAIGNIASPKDQFVHELSRVHEEILNERLEKDRLFELASGDEDSADSSHPLLGKLAGMSGIRHKLIGRKQVLRAFTPEIVKGIEQFLQQQGSVAAEAAPAPEHSSVMRRVVGTLAPGTLRNLPNKIEAMLANTYAVLPEDGARFKESVYAMCRNIAEQTHQPQAGRDFTGKLLEEVSGLLKPRR